MKHKFQNWNPKEASIELIVVANSIIEEYDAMGYSLTLRQLYYQFVARGVIDNSMRSYKNLGGIMTKARMAGLVDWNAIEDRTRESKGWLIEEDIMNPIKELPYQVQFNPWAVQDTYIEVWVEKDALSPIIRQACQKYRVRYLACKGYLSSSESYRSGSRFREAGSNGKNLAVIHLGDHDPSGMDMTRDNRDRLNIFSPEDNVHVERIALNMNQVEELNPPPNPAKLSDSRAKDYISRYGRTSWELDAVSPEMLETIIQDEIRKHVDWGKWDDVMEAEEEAKDKLRGVYTHWSKIEENYL